MQVVSSQPTFSWTDDELVYVSSCYVTTGEPPSTSLAFFGFPSTQGAPPKRQVHLWREGRRLGAKTLPTGWSVSSLLHSTEKKAFVKMAWHPEGTAQVLSS